MSRYWFFSDVVPGLYIEKGWVHDSIDYSFTPPPEEKTTEPDVDDEDDGEAAVTQGRKYIYVHKHVQVMYDWKISKILMLWNLF